MTTENTSRLSAALADPCRRNILRLAIGFAPLLCVSACGLFGPGSTEIRVEGTVRAADDNAPLAAAVRVTKLRFFDSLTLATARADDQGFYSLSFSEGRCSEILYEMVVELTGFRSQRKIGLFPPPVIRCTEELQVVDFSLERLCFGTDCPISTSGGAEALSVRN